MAGVAFGAAFVVLTGVAVSIFLAAFAPKPHQKPVEPFLAYDPAAMRDAVRPERVRERLEALLACGSRYMGQPGFDAAQQYIRRQFEQAGLTPWEHHLTSVAPHTTRAELSIDGTVQDVQLYPFLPNHMQPMNTPDGGLTGELVLLGSDVLRNRRSFTGCIGLLDVSGTAPPDYGYDWARYAQLGISALIAAHPDGLDAIKWAKLKSMAYGRNPVNYVRLAASPEIVALAGRTVTLHVRTAYRPVDATTLVARIQAGTPAAEAVVIPSSYDAGSLLPDSAPGTAQALPVAMQLALLDGLLPYREQLRRDVIFVCFGAHTMAQDSQNRLLAALGRKTNPAGRAEELRTERAGNEAALKQVEQFAGLFDDEQFFRDPDATASRLQAIGPAAGLFDQQCTYVRNTIVFEVSEQRLQAKVAFDKAPESEEAAYAAARKRYDKAFAAAGHNIAKLLREQTNYLAEYDVRGRMKQRLADLLAYHRQQQKRLDEELALNKLFAGYDSIVVLSPELTAKDGGEDAASVSFTMGADSDYTSEHPVLFRNHLLSAVRQTGLEGKAAISFTGASHGGTIASQTGRIPVESRLWQRFSYPAFSLVNTDRAEAYTHWFDPVELPWVRRMDGMDQSLALLGECVLSAAFGNTRFPGVKTLETIPTYNGYVYVANVGQSILPNYPMPGALLGCKTKDDFLPGYFDRLFFQTNSYGRYRYPYCATVFGDTWDYSPDAAIYGADGVISHIKDCGLSAQSIYKSMKLGGAQASDQVNLSLYRAAPVTLLDLINPQTLKPFAGVAFLRSRGLTAFANTNVFTEGGITTTFIKPDERFYVTLNAGSPENELTQSIRAFMLGTRAQAVGAADSGSGQPQTPADDGREIRGEGYLAQDTPLLLDVPLEIARSMIELNGRRLALQNGEHYRMADERAETFHNTAVQLLEEAESGELPEQETLLVARDAATYAESNHPVLRKNIYEAVVGVLWYLGLLVPFVFFFEKLVFGFADIRKQLAAVAIIFLIAFGLLKLLHPAFAMIRSSLMVLLGFVILLISLGITVLFSSKFQENLEEIKRRRGRVTAAEVNKMGVLATAFLLGLNNMHRRRVRTWLTCATLVLMTFVMISFTSVQSDLVDTQTAVGKAPFSGLVVKNERFEPMAEGEAFALKSKYGYLCEVAPRHMFVGTEDWTSRKRYNPQVRVTYGPDEAQLREATLDSIVRLSPAGPVAEQIKLLTHRGWFTRQQAEAEEGLVPVMISDAAARELAITPAMVDAPGDLVVNVNDQRVLLYGIFEAESLRRAHDLDGKNLLPFDVTALRELNQNAQMNILAEDDDPRIAPEKILLAPTGRWEIPVGRSVQIIHSVAVVFPPDFGYRRSKELIDHYLEQTGRITYYGLDGFTFLGRRARARTVDGLVEMLIPLVIAALTVLNTMKGSVYERKDEIFVYNSVGIAPRHVFFMFFTEAAVYAVVGSVLGYLLSQGTGRVLSALNFTGGLNMTFASASTIYASLAIAASVFVSTWFPARTAMRIATPTEDVGWRLPEPEGDTWSFRVPFTFSFRDRIAILAFFSRYFEDHGEGGSGAFFAGRPQLGVSKEGDPLADGAPIPQLEVPVWPKPFDLGVSQVFRIALGTDPETREFIPTITLERLSGSRENWMRLNRRFIALVRQRLLHWRAVGTGQRNEMFEEAKKEMMNEDVRS